MKKQIRIGVVGCGGIASSVHGPSYVRYSRENPLERVCCADIDGARASAFAEQYGFDRFYTDYIEMIAREALDAICVLTSETMTAQIALDIMTHCDSALLIEKPPGRTPAETKALIEIAKRRGIVNQVAFNRRHMPIVKALKNQIGGDAIDYIRCDFYRTDRRDEDFAATAIHGIDTVCWLVDAPVIDAHFRYQEFPEAGNGVCNIYMDITFQSGTIAHLAFCPMSGGVVERLTVNARDRMLMAHLPVWNGVDAPGRLTELRSGAMIFDISGTEICDGDEMYVTNGFYAENASFFDDLLADVAPRDHLETALVAVEIADCIRRRADRYYPGESGR